MHLFIIAQFNRIILLSNVIFTLGRKLRRHLHILQLFASRGLGVTGGVIRTSLIIDCDQQGCFFGIIEFDVLIRINHT